MATTPAELPLANQPAAPTNAAVERKGQRWFELCLVLALAFGSSVYNALHILRYGVTPDIQRTTGKWFMANVHEIVMLLLLGYVLSRTGRTLRDIGLRWSLRDAGAGVILCVFAYPAYYAGAVLIGYLLWASGIHPARLGAKELYGGGFSVFEAMLSTVNPFFEELIVRAYLMTEIRTLTGSAAVAVAVSTALQTSYHLYYGWWTALAMGVPFLMLSLYFARWRQALPLVVTHEIFDWVAMIGLWR
jgi:membrane protease YdiL (CAAX protease family)